MCLLGPRKLSPPDPATVGHYRDSEGRGWAQRRAAEEMGKGKGKSYEDPYAWGPPPSKVGGAVFMGGGVVTLGIQVPSQKVIGDTLM